jgi:hypothetical protein
MWALVVEERELLWVAALVQALVAAVAAAAVCWARVAASVFAPRDGRH